MIIISCRYEYFKSFKIAIDIIKISKHYRILLLLKCNIKNEWIFRIIWEFDV